GRAARNRHVAAVARAGAPIDRLGAGGRRGSRRMNCHDTDRLLGAYMDDELGPTEAAAIRDHLDACVTCRQQLAHLESLGRLVRSIQTYPAPARLRLKVMTARRRA